MQRYECPVEYRTNYPDRERRDDILNMQEAEIAYEIDYIDEPQQSADNLVEGVPNVDNASTGSPSPVDDGNVDPTYKGEH